MAITWKQRLSDANGTVCSTSVLFLGMYFHCFVDRNRLTFWRHSCLIETAKVSKFVKRLISSLQVSFVDNCIKQTFLNISHCAMNSFLIVHKINLIDNTDGSDMIEQTFCSLDKWKSWLVSLSNFLVLMTHSQIING